ncbi:hypothetical protein H4R18_004397 [Coemansia javaensis]|uniref:Uncharacterized protein n=1 Tax=Coemansia javaensis TaxID=2761396 RepID=A0A9W8LH59_9FUNG|nr:hypothetical protein H4R18_004397 [Coemansia javaensis]
MSALAQVLLRYEPPEGFEQQKGSTAALFDAAAVDGKELWLLRIPDNVSIKHLDGVQIKHPKGASDGVLGEVAVAGATYQICSPAAGAAAAEFGGMREMRLLVPDSDDADRAMLTLLPNGCKRLLSVTEKVDVPDATEYACAIAAREPAARPQLEDMKLRFIPYGFYSADEYKALGAGGDSGGSSPPAAAAEPALKKKKKSKKSTGDAMDVDAQDKTPPADKKPKKKKKAAESG